MAFEGGCLFVEAFDTFIKTCHRRKSPSHTEKFQNLPPQKILLPQNEEYLNALPRLPLASPSSALLFGARLGQQIQPSLPQSTLPNEVEPSNQRMGGCLLQLACIWVTDVPDL